MYKSLLISFLIFLTLFTTCCGNSDYESISSLETISPSENLTVTDTTDIGVYVCGEVLNPGIYYFESNARVEDAINAAGGITAEGTVKNMNLAEYLKDCDKVYVPSIDEEADLNEAQISDGKININSASLEELMTLPGIGESKAQCIIDYRQEHGAYKEIEEIKNISGIKSGVFEKIKDLIKV